jgi:hypothetical protein
VVLGFCGVYIRGDLGASDCHGVCHIEFLDEVQAVGLCYGFPAIVGCGVAFLLEEVLQFVVVSSASGP